MDIKDLKKKYPKALIYDDHKLVTRRDFLKAGVIPFAASITPLSVLEALLMGSNANAVVCPPVGGGGPMHGFLPLMTVHLSGGGTLAANRLAKDIGGNIITNMDTCGLGNALSGANSTSFQGVGGWFTSNAALDSGFLRGLKQAATQTGLPPLLANYLQNTAVLSVCVPSQDDSSMNPFDISSLAKHAGVTGTNIAQVAGPSSPGNLPVLATEYPAAQQVAINSVADLTSAVGVGGILQTTYSNVQRGQLFGLIKRLSDEQASRLLASSANGQEVADLVDCSTAANQTIAAATPPAVDPFTVTAAAAGGTGQTIAQAMQLIWGATPSTQDAVAAASAYVSLTKLAGAVKHMRGGYDYHNGTRTSGDAKDLEAGLLVGHLLQTAAALQIPLYLWVATDGACRSMLSSAQDSVWTSDGGSRGMNFVFAYDPAGRPKLSAPPTIVAGNADQMGYFTSAQTASNSLIPGWNATSAALAVAYNYLVLSKLKAGLALPAAQAFAASVLDDSPTAASLLASFDKILHFRG